jgi:hypothetical protein
MLSEESAVLILAERRLAAGFGRTEVDAEPPQMKPPNASVRLA